MTLQEQITWLRQITSCHGYCGPDGTRVPYDSAQAFQVHWWLYDKILGGRFTSNKIPPGYSGAKTINGILFRVEPSKSRPGNRRCNHRVFVHCPVCGRAIPVGRFRQHITRADHQSALVVEG